MTATFDIPAGENARRRPFPMARRDRRSAGQDGACRRVLPPDARPADARRGGRRCTHRRRVLRPVRPAQIESALDGLPQLRSCVLLAVFVFGDASTMLLTVSTFVVMTMSWKHVSPTWV
jgi:hypothetical protein